MSAFGPLATMSESLRASYVPALEKLQGLYCITAGHRATGDEIYDISDNLVSLLSVYTTQFGSYTTLLWQVPALGLTAQSFLLAITLGSDINKWSRIIASVLSIIIAAASGFLMHNQRGRAINHGELAKRVSEKLFLADFLGSFEIDDGVPKKTQIDAQNVWGVDRLIYHGWRLCMYLFMIADIVVIYSVWHHLSWIR